MDKENKRVLFDTVIVGCGPAGLTAAIYSGRARFKTVVLQSRLVASQVLTTSEVENYPGFVGAVSGFELIDKFQKQAESFGVEIVSATVSEIRKNKENFQVVTDDQIYDAKSVIIASGAQPKELGVDGEIRLRGKGVSYCGTCDGAFFRNKKIIVVGGGDTAVEEALFLTKFAETVTIVHRRDRLRAVKILEERAFSCEKISFIWDSVVRQIEGAEKVESIILENVKSKEKEKVFCDGVFIFVGYLPNVGFMKDFLDKDEKGYIITDSNMVTSHSGIFACGDCRNTSLRQVITACGDGAIAAQSARYYLEELMGVGYK
ncbi:MAG: thioredoxin-disulfide reductase [Candidatus Omnitrophica bacterium]|nr:thioredoxin-disulfide reductase [Candidatus Omnitrophota bacterium]